MTITIHTDEHDLIIDPTAKRHPILTADDARALTDEITRTSVRLWVLVTEAYERKAHFALGFDTWDEYVRAELRMSPANSYQLLDLGRVMREIAAAGIDLADVQPVPRRIVARVKDRLPEVRKAARAAAKAGEEPNAAIRALARTPRTAEPEPETEAPTVRVPEPRRPSGRTLVECPCCHGRGQVTRAQARRIETALA